MAAAVESARPRGWTMKTTLATAARLRASVISGPSPSLAAMPRPIRPKPPRYKSKAFAPRSAASDSKKPTSYLDLLDFDTFEWNGYNINYAVRIPTHNLTLSLSLSLSRYLSRFRSISCGGRWLFPKWLFWSVLCVMNNFRWRDWSIHSFKIWGQTRGICLMHEQRKHLLSTPRCWNWREREERERERAFSFFFFHLKFVFVSNISPSLSIYILFE